MAQPTPECSKPRVRRRKVGEAILSPNPASELAYRKGRRNKLLSFMAEGHRCQHSATCHFEAWARRPVSGAGSREGWSPGPRQLPGGPASPPRPADCHGSPVPMARFRPWTRST